jgi:hypothetical protein
VGALLVLRVADVDGVGAGGYLYAVVAGSAAVAALEPGQFRAATPVPNPAPKPGDVRPAHSLDEHGRGLVLVEALADRWEVLDRDPAPGKTVRAELDLRLP